MKLKSKSNQINEAKLIQKEYSHKVVTKDILPKQVRKVCGADISYKNNIAFCSCVMWDIRKEEPVEIANSSMKVKCDYIPGLFMLREAEPILETLRKLKSDFGVLLIGGHGQLHPRKCGLACYVGILIQKPTIGVAKNLLCGIQRQDSKIEFNGKILGNSIKSENKTIFVSVGNMISLDTASIIVKKLIYPNRWYPEPLYLADTYSKKRIIDNSKN